MVVTEALARGLPVLASRRGRCPGGARPRPGRADRPGLLVPPGDGTRWPRRCGAGCRPGPAQRPARRPPAERRTRAAPGGRTTAGPRRRGPRGGGGMSRRRWRSWALAGGAALLVVVLWRTGLGPFVDGLRSLDAGTLALGAALAVSTTVACAWRWHLVARGSASPSPLGPAVASYYRAQFLNTHPARRGPRRRAPRVCARPGRRGHRPGAARGRVGAARRPGRPGGDRGRRPAAPPVPGALVHAGRARGAGRARCSPRPAGLARPVGRTPVAAGADPARPSATTCWRLARVPPAWPGVVLASAVAVGGHVATYLLAAARRRRHRLALDAAAGGRCSCCRRGRCR